MVPISATWMRGGTSKCWVFQQDQLQVPGMSVDEVLLRLFGSPDHRQVDGIGGGTSTTSKAVILSRSERPDVDVDYTFAQVGIEEARVDWGSNCGNCSAVAAPYAVHAGWVTPSSPSTRVRVFNTNTNQVIVQDLPSPEGQVAEEASTSIPGVPFLGAPVRMGFIDPAGRTTGQLFPTGNPSDDLPDGPRTIRATMVDAGAPVVAVHATDVGLTGDESLAEVDAQPDLLGRLDRIRRHGAVAMGLADTPETAARAIPKLALVDRRREAGTDLAVLMLSMGRTHPAVPITGSVAITLAAREQGTVVADLMESPPTDELALLTAAGVVTTFVSSIDGRPVIGATRTYRRLAEGVVFLPDPDQTGNGAS